MKIILAFHSGFSSSLFGFEATMIVGGRGSFSCSWLEESGPVERRTPRHRFALDPETFQSITAALAALPSETLGPAVDDCPVRSIRSIAGDHVVERHRRVFGPPETLAEREFDPIWLSLFESVIPLLVSSGVPGDIIRAVP